MSVRPRFLVNRRPATAEVWASISTRLARRVMRTAIATLALGALALSARAGELDALFAENFVDTAGKPVALAEYRGKPLLVNFWARWCVPCRKEIPEFERAHAAHGKDGLVVLGIGLETSGDAVADFAKAYDMTYPLLLVGHRGPQLMQSLGNAYAGLPFTVAITRDGRVVARKAGLMTPGDIAAAAAAALEKSL